MEHLVLTVIARDQTGLVERIATCVGEHGGNWLESRMARMAGQFAGILRVAVPADSQDELLDALEALALQDIHVQGAPAGAEPVCNWRPMRLELVGDDRPGLLREVTRVLGEQGVNIEVLDTAVSEAPMGSETLFRAQALLAVPLPVAPGALQHSLERLADDLMVELRIEAQQVEPSV